MKSWWTTITIATALAGTMACGGNNTADGGDTSGNDASDVAMMGDGDPDAMTENCYRRTDPMMQPFCPAATITPPLMQNAQQPNFVITQIDISTPRSLLPTSAVGRLLNTAISGARFLWGIQLDMAMNTIRTGTLDQMGVMPVPNEGVLRNSFRFLNGGAPMTDGGMSDPNRWNPVSGPITVMGETFSTMMIPLVTVPVFSDDGTHSLLAELPLRNTQMRNVAMNNMRGCVGLARYQYSSCISGRWYTTDPMNMMPYGILEAFLTVADARNVPIPSLMGNLCQFIAGVDCTMPMNMWPNQPDGMVDGQPAWRINANFAAIAGTIAR